MTKTVIASLFAAALVAGVYAAAPHAQASAWYYPSSGSWYYPNYGQYGYSYGYPSYGSSYGMYPSYSMGYPAYDGYIERPTYGGYHNNYGYDSYYPQQYSYGAMPGYTQAGGASAYAVSGIQNYNYAPYGGYGYGYRGW